VDFKIFKNVALTVAGRGVDVYFSGVSEVLEGFGFYAAGASIHLYRPDQKPNKVVYRGTIFKHQLTEWIVNNSLGSPIARYNTENQRLFELGNRYVLRFLSATPDESFSTPFLTNLANKHPDIKIAISNSKDFQTEFETFCPREAQICVIAHDKNHKTFPMQSDPTDAKLLETFITELKTKKLRQKGRSEILPTTEPGIGDVILVVGTTFEKVVMDETHDVFIDLYAPWCQHCKILEPRWADLAKEFDPERVNTVIARMDVEANDIPEHLRGVYTVTSYPTMYLAKKGAKMSPIAYDGQKTVPDMKAWLEENKTPD